MTSNAAAAPAAPKAAPSSNGELSHNQILTILSGLLMGMFLAALDQTIVSTAIRTIGDDLHGLDAQAWVTTAYLITSTIATPLYGKLSDMFGRKPFFLFAISIFIAGSALCSFSTSMYMLAAFRAVQGIGAGGLFTLALAIIADIVPPRERAKYQGYFLAVFGTSSVLGPVIGGFFAEQDHIMGLTGWRWVFLINVPIGILALFVVARTLHLQHTPRKARIDYMGALALTVGLVPLLTVAEQGRTWGWGSGKALVCFAIGIIGILAFIAVEARMGEEALIPLHLFKNRATTITIVASVIVGMGMFGAMMMLPLYMQIVHNASPMKSGFMMLPLVAGMMGASIVAGNITAKTGRVREFPIVGTAVVAIGMFLLHTISADTHLWLVMIYMFIVGIGLGNCMQALTLIVQNAVEPREIGMATSAATFFRQIGGTAGTSVFLSMLFSVVGGNIASALKDASTQSGFKQAVGQAMTDKTLMKDQQAYGIVQAIANPKQYGSQLSTINSDSSVIGRLPKAIAHPFEAGFATSMDRIFLLACFVMIVGFIVLWFLPSIELRKQSGQAAASTGSTKAEPAEAGEGAVADATEAGEGAVADATEAGAALSGAPVTADDVVTTPDAEAAPVATPVEATSPQTQTAAAATTNSAGSINPVGGQVQESPVVRAEKPETGSSAVRPVGSDAEPSVAAPSVQDAPAADASSVAPVAMAPAAAAPEDSAPEVASQDAKPADNDLEAAIQAAIQRAASHPSSHIESAERDDSVEAEIQAAIERVKRRQQNEASAESTPRHASND